MLFLTPWAFWVISTTFSISTSSIYMEPPYLVISAACHDPYFVFFYLASCSKQSVACGFDHGAKQCTLSAWSTTDGQRSGEWAISRTPLLRVVTNISGCSLFFSFISAFLFGGSKISACCFFAYRNTLLLLPNPIHPHRSLCRSLSDKQVKEKIADLGIQVDNLCTMLPQVKHALYIYCKLFSHLRCTAIRYSGRYPCVPTPANRPCTKQWSPIQNRDLAHAFWLKLVFVSSCASISSWNQDKVGSFSELSPDKLLLETQQALSSDRLYEPHLKLIEMQESVSIYVAFER